MIAFIGSDVIVALFDVPAGLRRRGAMNGGWISEVDQSNRIESLSGLCWF